LITQRDGECKGYAFAEFPSAEHAQFFIRAYAGSAGDRDAPQLIIENRAVTVEFARDRERDFERRDRDPGRHDQQTSRRSVKSDWLCDTCSCHNFAKRDSCFKCNAPRTEKCPVVNAGDRGFDPAGFPDSLVATDVPGTFLVARGFSPLIAEEQLNEVFRQFAQVKSVVLIRDPATNFSRGLAYIEFHSIDHATYALQNTNNMLLGGGDVSIAGSSAALKVAFARESTMRQLIHKSMQPGNVLAVNPMVTAALQAAQWSVNNSYAAASSSTQPNAATAAPPLFVKVKPKWPLPFETNGGAYLFQAKSGCFFEPVSEFYYDAKAKLYYNSIDGTYYHYDGITGGEGNNPFKLFIPPPPTEVYPDHASTAAIADTADANPEDPSHKNNKNSSILPATMTKSAIGSKVSIGFGLIGAKLKSKKIVTDIAKWGQIQQDNRSDEEEEAAKKTGKDKKSSSSSAAAAVVVADKASIVVSSISNSEAKLNDIGSGAVKRERSDSDLSHLQLSKQTRDYASSMPRIITTTDAIAVNNHNSSSVRTEQKPVIPVGTRTVGANMPVCLVCKRQFASHEMLQRHERESKLHAENLLKLSQA